jgi:hypothetical protein
MTSFSASTTKGNFNPYRHGVLMGNFVEDTFGMDLQKRYQTESTVQGSGYKKPFPISEFTDKFRWPVKGKEQYLYSLDEMSRTNTSGFNRNIDFTITDCNYYTKLLKGDKGKNGSNVPSKNNNSGNINSNNNTQQSQGNTNTNGDGVNTNGNVVSNDKLSNQMNNNYIQQGPAINGDMSKKRFAMTAQGFFPRKNNDLSANLLLGHGLNQQDWKKTEYASTYHLAMNKRIPTKTFYNTKFKVNAPFMHPPKTNFDNTDWGFRRFKTYEDFTKKFDKGTILEK